VECFVLNGVLKKLARSYWVRVIVSAGLLALIATRIDFSNALHSLVDGEWGWFALAVLALVLASALASYRWHLYLQACDVDRSWRRALSAYFLGVFTSNFLPSQVGGDVLRALMVGRQGARVRSFATVVIDRASALACLIAVAWAFVAADPGAVPRSLVLTLAVVSALFAAFVAAVLGAGKAGSRLLRFLPGRLRPAADEALAAVRASLRGAVLAKTLLLGVVFQTLGVVAACSIGRSIGLSVATPALVTSLPLVVVLSFLPFSIGGLGIREGGFVVLLGQAGVSATDATVFSLLNGLAFALASLPGVIAFVRAGRSAAKEPPPAPLRE
jgi:uncharacterized membrane protein YbhN (UPF0104 family)